MWLPQTSVLSESITVLTPNFPGFGDEPLRGDVTSMDAAAERAFELMRANNLERVAVCGLSMGGYAALAFWRRFPERVGALILANTRAGADDDAGKQRRRDLAARLRSEGNGFLADSPPPLLSEAAPPELLDRVKGMIRRQSPEAIAAAALGMAERPDVTADLASINVPTLVITSANDTLIPPAATQEMANAIPNARFETIANAGHLSNLEAPGEFNRLVLDALDAAMLLR
jgi:3-oxoadipate enol-lactonase